MATSSRACDNAATKRQLPLARHRPGAYKCCMRYVRRESGQAITEYVAVVLVVAMSMLALSSVDLGPQVSDALANSVCEVVGLASCREEGDSSPLDDLPDPELSPAQRALLLGDPADAQSVLSSLSPGEREWLQRNDPEASAAVARAQEWGRRRETVDSHVGGDLDDFLAYRESPEHDPDLDYTNNGCSAPLIGSSGISWNFLQACVRHDFGYRNYKRLGLFDERRAAVDRIFLDDMRDHCASRSLPLRPTCYQRAVQFYGAVRAFGG